jgi:hypothetical protein
MRLVAGGPFKPFFGLSGAVQSRTESSYGSLSVFVSSIPTRSPPPKRSGVCASLQSPHSKFRKEREI